MNPYEFKVKIEAETPEQAKALLTAMFDLMKTAKAQTSAADFIRMATKIKAQPALVKQAMMFI